MDLNLKILLDLCIGTVSIFVSFNSFCNITQSATPLTNGCYEIMDESTRGFAFQLHGQTSDSLARYVSQAQGGGGTQG